ncbi:IGF-like family receptor 1 isoform 2-T2 [Pholidichthys leucotaenia]
MGHSKKCPDVVTRWDPKEQACVLCRTKVDPGMEVTPNCGRDDDGGFHESPTKKCPGKTFNDGSKLRCQPCSICPDGAVLKPCNFTANTVCTESTRSPVTLGWPRRLHTPTSQLWVPQTPQGSNIVSTVVWAVPLAPILSMTVAALCILIIKKKLNKGQSRVSSNRRPSYINVGFSPLLVSADGSNLEEVLNAEILSAPLKTVLDNLDVLEELVVLLDPETSGIKNTKHLASLCSFPFSWITYTYSLKDSKSPLKAVLEGVTSKNPDWTVGDLAKLLRQMERNDAVAVLTKLTPN